MTDLMLRFAIEDMIQTAQVHSHNFLYKIRITERICVIGKQHKGRDVSRLIVNPAKYFLFSRQVHLPGK